MISFEEAANGLYTLKVPFNTIWSMVYLVCGKVNVLVDTCVSADKVDTHIIPALKSLGMEPQDINYLINTHAHGDHAGGNGRFLEVSGCSLAAFETGKDKMINPLKYNRATRSVFPEHSPAPAEFLPAHTPDLVLKDGDMLGNRLRVYHAPGHDTECILLYDIPSKSILSGDSLQGFGMLGEDGAGVAFYKDLAGYRRTVSRARALECENIIAGHDFAPIGAIARGRSEAELFLDNCEQVMRVYDCLVRRELENGATDVAEIARAVLHSIGAEEPPYLFMTMYTVREHIREILAQKG